MPTPLLAFGPATSAVQGAYTLNTFNHKASVLLPDGRVAVAYQVSNNQIQLAVHSNPRGTSSAVQALTTSTLARQGVQIEMELSRDGTKLYLFYLSGTGAGTPSAVLTRTITISNWSATAEAVVITRPTTSHIPGRFSIDVNSNDVVIVAAAYGYSTGGGGNILRFATRNGAAGSWVIAGNHNMSAQGNVATSWHQDVSIVWSEAGTSANRTAMFFYSSYQSNGVPEFSLVGYAFVKETGGFNEQPYGANVDYAQPACRAYNSSPYGSLPNRRFFPFAMSDGSIYMAIVDTHSSADKRQAYALIRKFTPYLSEGRYYLYWEDLTSFNRMDSVALGASFFMHPTDNVPTFIIFGTDMVAPAGQPVRDLWRRTLKVYPTYVTSYDIEGVYSQYAGSNPTGGFSGHSGWNRSSLSDVTVDGYWGKMSFGLGRAVFKGLPESLTPASSQTVGDSTPLLSVVAKAIPSTNLTMRVFADFEISTTPGFDNPASVWKLSGPLTGYPANIKEDNTSTKVNQSASVATPIPPGSYYLRARLRDTAGNVTNWVTNGSPFTVSHGGYATTVSLPYLESGLPTETQVVSYTDPNNLGYSEQVVSWEFGDPWDEDYQSAYQVRLLAPDGTTTLYTTGKVVKRDNYATIRIPQNFQNQLLKIEIQVWDRYDTSAPRDPQGWGSVYAYAPPEVFDVNVLRADSPYPTFDFAYRGGEVYGIENIIWEVTSEGEVYQSGTADYASTAAETVVSLINDGSPRAAYVASTNYFGISGGDGYGAGGAGTEGIVNEAGLPYDGPSFFRRAWTTATSVATANVSLGSSRVPLVAGETYVASIYVRASIAKKVGINASFYPDASAAMLSSANGSLTDAPANKWVRVSLTFTVPVDATYVKLYVATSTGAAWPVGASLDIGGLIVTKGTKAVAYFDRQSTNTKNFTYSADADNGRSIRTLVGKRGTKSIESYMRDGNRRKQLENHRSYTLKVTVIDGYRLMGSSTTNFVTSWVSPPAATGVGIDLAGYNQEANGYAKVTWSDSARQADFLYWNLYRRMDKVDAWGNTIEQGQPMLVDTFYDQSAEGYTYYDYLAPSGGKLVYYVTQVVMLNGGEVESEVWTEASTLAQSEAYWLIDPTPEDPLNATFKLSNVTADSYTDEWESEKIHVIGKGYHIDRGDHFGKAGSLECQIRDTPGGMTARQKKQALERMKEEVRSLYLRTPFGDTFYVSIGDLEITRIAGVGRNEYCDVTIPYQEVYR